MADLANVAGLDALFRAMQELPPKLERKALRKAVTAAGMIIRDEARARAPVGTGRLKRAISYGRSNRDCAKGKEVGNVFVRKAKNGGNGGQKSVKAHGKFDAYYAVFVEYGHWSRSRKQGGKSVRKGAAVWIPAHPFLRPAWESRKNDALEAIKKSLAQSVEDEASGRGA